VNRLNVFPVPDGDTGTNMLLTLQSAVEDIKDSKATEVYKIAALAAHGSLMGARGNSGVILSQIFRGMAKAAQGKSSLNPAELADAFAQAATAGYHAAPKPTEGTILTVAREAGRAAVAAAAEPNATIVSVVKAAAKEARVAVENTPNQLHILKEAGVVDAGGYGLQIMLEGFLHSFEEGRLAGLPTVVQPARIAAAQVAVELPEEGWGYCTEFLVEGDNLNVEEIRYHIEGMGNSVLVVGEPSLVKVHVHTNDPKEVMDYAATLGRLAKINVGDMSQQHRRILEEAGSAKPDRTNGLGLVAVASGPGLVDIFRGLGADVVVEGGQTMNPSTQDMLGAVTTAPYQEVILLPNNGNVILAAAEVTKLSSKTVHLLETHTMPQGIAAAVAFSPELPPAEVVKDMRKAADHVQTIEVTRAVRDTRSNGMRVKKGDVICLVNDKLKYKGDAYGEVVRDAISGLGADSYELVTVYRGEGATDSEANLVTSAIHETFPKLEVEMQTGGQEHYPFILSIE
jgi:DAK2 domain fusion protein YloV